MGQLLSSIVRNTNEFLQSKSKTERKDIGQFFTDESTAQFMARMFKLKSAKKNISVLDAGAGTGVLTAAFIEEAEKYSIEEVNITLVEDDLEVMDVLYRNSLLMKEKSNIRINVKILKENYITMQFEGNDLNCQSVLDDFDFVISNPPYKKIPRKCDETIGLDYVISGSPNLYFLFMTLSIRNLKENGEMVYIIPRSWTSGAYFKKFREHLFAFCSIEAVHLFVSRKDVFKTENVLQETMIIKLVKSRNKKTYVNISSSIDTSFEDVYNIVVPHDIVVRGRNAYVYLPTDEHQLEVLRTIDSFKFDLPSIGLKAKTGLTVNFRNRKFLKNVQEKNTTLLLHASNIQNGRIVYPMKDGKEQYINISNGGLLQKNKDYLLFKRFSSKEESKRLQVGVYLKEDFNHEYISTDNKVNFIEKIDKEELPRHVIYGLYCLFNSTLYDQYYRILNGSTQVNATEVNQMPIPSIESIEKLGCKLLVRDNLSIFACDIILNDFICEEK